MGKKDPNAPKRPMSAYFLWQNVKRADVKAEFPDLKIGEIAGKLGLLWKEVSADDRVEWQEKADAAKATYAIDKAEYLKNKPESEEDEDDDEGAGKKRKGKGKGNDAKKAKKDPNAPKRPMSAFFLWQNANRADVKAENPDLKPTEIAGKLGLLWKEVSDDDRVEWQEKAEAAKATYQQELAAYKAKAADETEEEE